MTVCRCATHYLYCTYSTLIYSYATECQQSVILFFFFRKKENGTISMVEDLLQSRDIIVRVVLGWLLLGVALHTMILYVLYRILHNTDSFLCALEYRSFCHLFMSLHVATCD